MTAGTLALWIGAAFAAVAATAASIARAGDDRGATAARALAMSAAFTSVALGMLLFALWQADLTVDYVARHTTIGATSMSRLLAVCADPAGAGLAAAALLTAVGAWLVRRGDAPGLAAVCAVTTLVLVAAPLAGHPLAQLGWLPLDGQDALPFFRQSLAMAHVAAVLGAVTSAAIALGRAVGEWQGRLALSEGPVAARLTLLCVAWQAMAHTEASLAAGLSRDVSPLLARGGGWLVACVVALVGALVMRAPSAPAQARVEAALGALLATVALVLAPPAVASPSLAVRVLGLLALVVASVGLWRAGPALRYLPSEIATGLRQRRWGSILATAAAFTVLVAILLGAVAGRRQAALASGGHVVLGRGAELDHLGVSRYDDLDAQVMALALERRASGTRLASAEHREYSDSRGSVVGQLLRRPAVFHGLASTTVVWLEEVAANDDAQLAIIVVPGHALWWIALGLLTLSTIAFIARASEPFAGRA